MSAVANLRDPKILLSILLLAAAAIFWELSGPGTMPVNDCGLHYHLQLDKGNGEYPCDLGVVSADIVSKQVKAVNDELDKTDPLPKTTPSGVPFLGRIGIWDDIMAAWDRFFMGIDPFPPNIPPN